uniref:hypothetical protein n=1 Tax=Eubacterium cellulosolvens TaxID=29322 RepID=UPI000688F5A6|nr:hypothetical protein [[Eubacterium] cellulosolvens]
MRYSEFKMEREGLVSVGQEVTFTESQLPTSYYYTIVPAVAMSRNYAPYERITSRTGVIKVIRDTPQGFYIVLELDEKEVEGETEADFRKMMKADTEGGEPEGTDPAEADSKENVD